MSWLAIHERLGEERLDETDPLDWFQAAGDGEDGFYLEHPSGPLAMAALGTCHAIEAAGSDRFAEIARQARQVFQDLHVAGVRAPVEAGPLLVGGFAFGDTCEDEEVWEGFPAARLVLPEILVVRRGSGVCLTATAPIQRGEDPDAVERRLRERIRDRCRRISDGQHGWAAGQDDASVPDRATGYHTRAHRPHAHYRNRIDAALQAITRGELEKVVVARSVRVRHEPGWNPADLARTLRASHPSCATFAVKRGGSTFLGASPERLLRVAGQRLEASAVAGTAPRGRSPEQDHRLGRALLESKKEQAEHAAVVRFLHERLAPRCRQIDLPEAPTLLRLEGIQHLSTPLEAELREPGTLLEMAGEIHPTPAVAGMPPEQALDWIHRHEGLARGWYAGPVGFLNREAGGELWVALRSALLRDERAHLFAGAGIVAGSEPEAELRETRLKLNTLLSPLLEI